MFGLACVVSLGSLPEVTDGAAAPSRLRARGSDSGGSPAGRYRWPATCSVGSSCEPTTGSLCGSATTVNFWLPLCVVNVASVPSAGVMPATVARMCGSDVGGGSVSGFVMLPSRLRSVMTRPLISLAITSAEPRMWSSTKSFSFWYDTPSSAMPSRSVAVPRPVSVPSC